MSLVCGLRTSLMKYYDITIPPAMSWGVEDKKKSSENIAIIKVKLYIDAKVVKEMRIATWMFPERGSEQERGGVDISCFKAKHMAFSENKVVPKPIVYHIVCLYYIYTYV